MVLLHLELDRMQHGIRSGCEVEIVDAGTESRRLQVVDVITAVEAEIVIRVRIS